jgi:uncharacterized hydrophobic protein (TIGR00341 family)
MATRLIEVFLPTDRLELARSSISSKNVIAIWSEKLSEDKAQLHVLAEAENSEEITDTIEEALADTIEQVRMVSLRVEASIPAPEAEEQKKHPARIRRGPKRVSRDELLSEVGEMMRTSYQNTALTMLAAVVAAIGLAKNSVALLIGAMVIAPLLGPNVGLSLAATLGDFRLGVQALKENFLRIGVALVFALLVGLVFRIDTSAQEILIRTQVDIMDVVVAFSAGAAGAFALTVGAPSALIGVMVAAALMPPLVSMGILAGRGMWTCAYGSLILLLVNLICINLSGVLVFLSVGLRPWRPEESSVAMKSRWAAVIVWMLALTGLVLLILERVA